MPNDMRDRFIELISDMENELLRSYPYTTDEYRIASIADHLIESGAILPPCKVGDTVYLIKYHYSDRRVVLPYKVTEILYSSSRGVRPFVFVTNTGYSFDNCDIGDIVFLTREDAEKALREREGE